MDTYFYFAPLPYNIKFLFNVPANYGQDLVGSGSITVQASDRINIVIDLLCEITEYAISNCSTKDDFKLCFKFMHQITKHITSIVVNCINNEDRLNIAEGDVQMFFIAISLPYVQAFEKHPNFFCFNAIYAMLANPSINSYSDWVEDRIVRAVEQKCELCSDAAISVVLARNEGVL